MDFATVAIIIYVIVMLALFFGPIKLLFKRFFTKDMGYSEAEYKSRIVKFDQYYGVAKFVSVVLAFVLFLIKLAFFS